MICTAEETRRTKPPLLFPPHRTHASPVNRCSSFVVSKQSCQTNAAAAIHSFITLVWYCCTCIALRVLSRRWRDYAVCHAACSSSSFLTAAPVAFTPLCSFLPPFRFISPRSQLAVCFKAGSRHQSTKANTQAGHQPLHKLPLQYSLGSIPLHYVIHSLQ